MKTPAMIRAEVRIILKRAEEAMAERRAAGLCLDPDCEKPPAGVPQDVLFFGDDYCEEHAREFEIEYLADEQQDDQDGSA